MTDTGFRIDVDHNEFMGVGDTTVDAIVTITSSENAAPPSRVTDTGLAQVIMVDCSGSMMGSRIAEAKRATRAVIQNLPDGTRFAVISGAAIALMVYPTAETTAVANPQTRAEAARAVDRLHAGGGTAMSSWIKLAHRVLTNSPAEVKHGLLLTDGFNQHESQETLTAVLDECQGGFVCDACGIGDDWHGNEIRLIADRLLGTASGLPEEAEWAEGFTKIAGEAAKKTVGDLTMRVFTPARNTIRFIKQMNPSIVDLTARRTELDDKTGDYPTGAWGAESREFHVRVDVPPIQENDDRLAARISVLSGSTELSRSMITARWSGDTMLSTKLNPKVAHYTGQAELASAIQEGVAAAKAGDNHVATERLGRAMQLATESGNERTARLLGKVVDVDVDTGRVHMKQQVKSVDLEMADVESVKTITVRRNPDNGGELWPPVPTTTRSRRDWTIARNAGPE